MIKHSCLASKKEREHFNKAVYSFAPPIEVTNQTEEQEALQAVKPGAVNPNNASNPDNQTELTWTATRTLQIGKYNDT